MANDIIDRTIVSIDDNYKWETEEEALAYGLKCKAYYRELATAAGAVMADAIGRPWQLVFGPHCAELPPRQTHATDYNRTRGLISPSTCKADQRHNRRMVRDADFRNACPSGNWIACGSRKHNHTVALLRETSVPNDLNKTINTRSGLMTYNMTPRNPEGRRSTVLATRHARRHLPSNPTNRYLPRQRLRKPAYWPRTHFIWTDNWQWALSWWWSTPIEKLRWGLR